MKIRCNKHKSNHIQFICLNNECHNTKYGCMQCFSEHDGHTKENMDIQAFFEKIFVKDKQLEPQYLQVINQNVVKKNKEQLIRNVQQQCRIIQSKVFNFIDRQQEAIIQQIQNKNLNDLGLQLKVRAYHEELERVKIKSLQTLENNNVEFLINYLQTDEYDDLLNTAIQTKNKNIQEFTYDINQMIDNIDHSFQTLYIQLDQQFSQQIFQLPSFDANKGKSEDNQIFTLGNFQNSPQIKKMSNEKSKSKSPLRFSSTNHSRTPDSAIKAKNYFSKQNKLDYSSNQIQVSNFLISSPEKQLDNFIEKNKNLEMIINHILINLLTFDYINEHLEYLKKYYSEFSQYNKFTKQNLIQLIQEEKGKFFYILWENLMIEWLKPILPQNIIQIKVYEIEDNFQAFFELFDKSLKIHENVAYVIKQKVKKPKIDYTTWFILANKNDNQYKLYNFKSASGKKISITTEQQSYNSVDVIKTTNIYAQFPYLLQEHLKGEFNINRDLKIIIKGIQDPCFQTYSLTERLQVLLNLITNQQVSINNNFSQIENHFDQVLINFKTFVNYLNMSLKDYND